MAKNVTEELKEQVLGVVRKSQEVTLEAVRKIATTRSAATAHLPAKPIAGKLAALPFAGRLHELPKLPAPGTVVASALDFAGRLLAEQRKFAEELVKAAAARRRATPDGTVGGTGAPVDSGAQ